MCLLKPDLEISGFLYFVTFNKTIKVKFLLFLPFINKLTNVVLKLNPLNYEISFPNSACSPFVRVTSFINVPIETYFTCADPYRGVLHIMTIWDLNVIDQVNIFIFETGICSRVLDHRF